MNITDKRAEAALTYLVETDAVCAARKAEAARAEWKAKAVKAAIFKRLDGTVAQREAEAETSPEYEAAKLAEFDALAEYEGMRNKRATEAIVIDAWRTSAANRRQGNV